MKKFRLKPLLLNVALRLPFAFFILQYAAVEAVGRAPAASWAILTPTLAPMRGAPASTILGASSNPLTAAEALTPSSEPTACRIKATSATVAPPLANPVEVLTKS